MSEIHLCPYCKTIYRYKDIIRLKGKSNKCYHCGKFFKADKLLTFIPVLITSIILIIINTIIIHNSKDLSTGSFITMAVTDAFFILISFVISPFMIRFIKAEKSGR